MKKAKSNSMYYLSVSDKGITKIHREDVNKAKEAVLNHTARFQLHAVFAPDIKSARQRVFQHKTEIFGSRFAEQRGRNKSLDPSKNASPKDLSGLIRVCGAYFPTTDSKGRKIQRCLFYQPVCNPKGCKTDTKLAEIKNPYQEEFPFLQFRKHPGGKYRAYYSGTNDLYEINNVPINFEFNSPKEGYRIMLYKLKPEIESLKHKTIPEQSSFIEPSQASLFGRFSGFTAVCKTFKKNAQGKRYCAKYAPVCGADAEG